jgi:hypothetical protein
LGAAAFRVVRRFGAEVSAAASASGDPAVVALAAAGLRAARGLAGALATFAVVPVSAAGPASAGSTAVAFDTRVLRRFGAAPASLAAAGMPPSPAAATAGAAARPRGVRPPGVRVARAGEAATSGVSDATGSTDAGSEGSVRDWRSGVERGLDGNGF